MKNKNIKTPTELHIELFGVEPVITGVTAMGDKTLDELIIESIENGIPYVEHEPEKDSVY